MLTGVTDQLARHLRIEFRDMFDDPAHILQIPPCKLHHRQFVKSVRVHRLQISGYLQCPYRLLVVAAAAMNQTQAEPCAV